MRMEILCKEAGERVRVVLLWHAHAGTLHLDELVLMWVYSVASMQHCIPAATRSCSQGRNAMEKCKVHADGAVVQASPVCLRLATT